MLVEMNWQQILCCDKKWVTTTQSFTTEDERMITDFDDFCTWVYVLVDDIWQQISPFFKRPGPQPICSDSELLAMALIGECRGWHMETELLSCWKEYRHLFPHIPSQSRFNRRRRNLMQAANLIRQVILRNMAVRAAAGRLVLLYLPTYSPWLNPIEMLWRHFRREVTIAKSLRR